MYIAVIQNEDYRESCELLRRISLVTIVLRKYSSYGIIPDSSTVHESTWKAKYSIRSRSRDASSPHSCVNHQPKRPDQARDLLCITSKFQGLELWLFHASRSKLEPKRKTLGRSPTCCDATGCGSGNGTDDEDWLVASYASAFT